MKSPKGNGAKTILVVEDEPAITNVCRRVLAKEGFEVDTAANGKVAQAMIKKKQYDSLLVDIRIPYIDGKELYQWLEKNYPLLKKKVIFTTGDVIGGDTQAFIESSGNPFLPKPFTPHELIAIMKEATK